MVKHNLSDASKQGKLEPQVIPDLFTLRQESSYFACSVESNNNGVFEVRFHNVKGWQN